MFLFAKTLRMVMTLRQRYNIRKYTADAILFREIQSKKMDNLKGTATLIISMFYQKELCEPWILIQVSSKSVEKWASYGHLKNLIQPTFSRHFEYLIIFSEFSQLPNF